MVTLQSDSVTDPSIAVFSGISFNTGRWLCVLPFTLQSNTGRCITPYFTVIDAIRGAQCLVVEQWTPNQEVLDLNPGGV